MIVVDPDVTRLKLERELELWHGNESIYRRRGWILLGRSELVVDIGFLGRLPLVGQPIPVMTACVRIDFTNFDLWPPSVEFIDPLTGQYAAPSVQALVDTDEGVRDLVIHSHPATNRPFFCVPGIREYHDHPQHSGDSWLLHRGKGEGSLATICDRVWRTMVRNLLGINVVLQTMPGQLQVQFRIASAPGEVAPSLWEQAKAARPASPPAGPVVPQQLPPQVLAALGIAPTPVVATEPEGA